MDPPALSPNDEDIPHCFIFATFMLSSMLGSSVASRLLAHQSSRPESYMQTVFTISSVSLLLPVVTNVHSTIFSLCPRFHFHVISFSQQLGGKTVNYELTVLYQTVFGSTVKRERWEHLVFWMYPTHWFLHIRSLRWDILAIYHEDEVNAFPMTVMFGMCSAFLFVASLLQRHLMLIAEMHKSRSQEWLNMEEMDSEAAPLNG
ncbi:hypothetical protein V6N13_030803 [Hibiscus sabdariffa]